MVAFCEPYPVFFAFSLPRNASRICTICFRFGGGSFSLWPYGYDTNNNLTSVKDANNNTTTYKYDDKGRVYQIISPDTGTTTYSYDAAGNLTSKTDAKGVTTSYQYDALNRLTKIDFSQDTDIVYTRTFSEPLGSSLAA